MIPLITSIVGIVVAASILWLIRRDVLEIGLGLAWMLVAGGFCLLGFAPFLVDSLANHLGISHAPSLAFTLALGLITLKLVHDDVRQSKQRVQLKRTIQRLAMLEAELERYKNAHNPTAGQADEEKIGTADA